MSYSEAEAELRAALDDATGTERIARAAGVLAHRARLANLSLVVSGGAAVVLLTARDFATGDIDVVTDQGGRLDAVLIDLGFQRRDPRQHIWIHQDLEVAVQSPASYLPPHSSVEDVEAPTGDTVTVWSSTDLIIDRLAQAVIHGARERLHQALAIRQAAGAIDIARARRRASDDGIEAAFDAFLDLYAALEAADGGESDTAEAQAAALIDRFWAALGR